MLGSWVRAPASSPDGNLPIAVFFCICGVANTAHLQIVCSISDDAVARAKEFLSELGYEVVIDPEGAHSITPSTFELIDKCIAKYCNIVEK